MSRSNIIKMFRKRNNLSNKGMRGGANGYNSGYNSNVPASNDEKKELARLNEEMKERQEKANKKKAGSKRRRRGKRE